MEDIRAAGAQVVGVSKDSVESHVAFGTELGLNFVLVSDDGTLCEAFDVWKLKKRGEEERMGIERSTFILEDGKIVREWRGMKAGGHVKEVVDALKAL